MRQPSYRSLRLLALLSLFPDACSAATAATQDLNRTVHPAAAEPAVLVRHDDVWHYRRGTNEPQGEWKTVGDSGLDTSWLTNAGGFGYGDPGIIGENTTLSGMTGVHSTLYVRRTFTVTNDLDGNAVLRLLVDYDDGFVAYLDGIELTRANLTNGPGTFVAHHDTTVTSHEASCCQAPTHAPEAFDVGLVGARLPPGDHVLALIGVNGTLGSSDFHLIADFSVEPAPEPPPGFVAGGTLSTNTVWHAGLGTVFVMSNVVVPADITLTIEPGVQVRVTNTASIQAQGGVIDIRGEYSNKVRFTSFSGSNNWGGFSANGTDAALLIRHTEIVGGPVKFLTNSVGLMEDSYLHHYAPVGSVIAGSTWATEVTLRRSRFAYYHETLFQFTRMLVEDCLFENADSPNGDCMDFDAAPPGSIVRRTTYRNGPQSNTDAIDIGSGGGLGSTGTLIYDCLMRNLTDKGVSIGEDSHGIVVSNCLMIATDRGVQVKDTCTATIANCTIVDSGIGIHCYEKLANTGGGRATNTYNNILWNNGLAVSIESNSVLVVHHTDLQNTNWPGEGNISADPLFMDAAAGDYRLRPGSPCLGTGLDGSDMGVHWPVGAFIFAPTNLAATLRGNAALLTWNDASETEAAFEIERSVNGGPFQPLVTVPINTTSSLDSNVPVGSTNRYRVRGVSVTAESDYSNETEAGSDSSPVIIVQPQSRLVVPGSEVQFGVAAFGNAPLSYSWLHGATALDGETNDVLSLTGVQPSQAGEYRVVVTDSAGSSATSAVARLTVALPPTLSPLTSATSLSNGMFTFGSEAPAEVSYVVEGSTNLIEWLPLQTNGTGTGLIEFTDSAATNSPHQFYRAILRP